MDMRAFVRKSKSESEGYINRKEINLCLIEAIDSDCLSVGRSQKVKNEDLSTQKIGLLERFIGSMDRTSSISSISRIGHWTFSAKCSQSVQHTNAKRLQLTMIRFYSSW